MFQNRKMLSCMLFWATEKANTTQTFGRLCPEHSAHVQFMVFVKGRLFPSCLPQPKIPRGPCETSTCPAAPDCLTAIFDSQLPSPKFSFKIHPKLSLPHNRESFDSSFTMTPHPWAIVQQLSGKRCLAALGCLSGPSG